jgi:hypothetical protein
MREARLDGGRYHRANVTLTLAHFLALAAACSLSVAMPAPSASAAYAVSHPGGRGFESR